MESLGLRSIFGCPTARRHSRQDEEQRIGASDYRLLNLQHCLTEYVWKKGGVRYQIKMEAGIMLFLLLLTFLSSVPSAAAQSNDSLILVSSELRPKTNSSVWLSESGSFAFGFYYTSSGYSICIFLTSPYFGRSHVPLLDNGVLHSFYKVTDVVWTANNLDPILPNNIGSLVINQDGIQLFQNIEGSKHKYYYEIAATGESIAAASMLDNGNFVVYNSNGGVIWQSFDYPTDTLLPGQRLRTGEELFSVPSKRDLGRGIFRLKMQGDGNLVQYPVSSPDSQEYAYYDSRTYGKGENFTLNLDVDGRLYLYDGTISYNISSGGKSETGSIYLARVDPDGIFRLRYRELDVKEGNLTVIWSSTEDRCAPKGICEVNSFCTYEDGRGNVTCTCLPGFGNGCKQDYNVGDCWDKNSSVVYEMRRMANVTWHYESYAASDKLTEQDCERACLLDCDCVVASFERGQCRKHKYPLRYGRKSMTESNPALFKVSLPTSAPPNASGFGKGLSSRHKYVIAGVSVGIAALVVSLIIVCYLRRRRVFCSRDQESRQNANKLILNHGSLAPRRYSYKEIREMTKSFTEKIGQGGYGIVYKGKLPKGELVAVKVLKETRDDAQEFVNEVASISRTSHVNIVNLLGFCFERKKRALVYEFMPNKSLDNYIHKRGSVDAECSLEWKKLYEIAVGIARGLEYLHKGCNTRIVHFDIKPQNILLDQHFHPKISDFGLAKLCMKTQSVISMLGTRGTIGYIAPEVFSRNFGAVSHKSDVYSYGIMLLQMAKARTNVEIKSFQSSEDYFLEKIYEHVLVKNEKVYDEIGDEEEEVVRKMLAVGYWCIQTAPSERPSMNRVVEMLAGNVENIQIPPLPFLLSSPKLEFSCLQLPVIVETQSSHAG